MIKGRLLALVRQVPNSFGQAVSLSQPAGTLIDVGLARRQWDAYVGTLRHLVDEVVEVPASEDHPECAAIEDLLVFARGTAVLTKPGNPSRRGEAAAVRSSLENNEGIKGIKLHMMSNMDPQATLNGQDVLFTGKHMFVGLNARTNDAGVECLKRAFGKSLPVIPIDLEGIGASAASLKSLVTSLRPGLLCVAANDVGLEVAGRMADAVGRSSYKAIAVPDEPSANVLSLNAGKWRGALLQADRCENSVGLIRGAFELNEQNSILEHEMNNERPCGYRSSPGLTKRGYDDEKANSHTPHAMLRFSRTVGCQAIRAAHQVCALRASSTAKGMPHDTLWLPMPRLSPSMKTGTIKKWLLSPGDEFGEYEAVLTIDTDTLVAEGLKTPESSGSTSMVVELLEAGFMAKLLRKEGETVRVGEPIALLCEEEDSVSVLQSDTLDIPHDVQLYEEGSGHKVPQLQAFLDKEQPE